MRCYLILPISIALTAWPLPVWAPPPEGSAPDLEWCNPGGKVFLWDEPQLVTSRLYVVLENPARAARRFIQFAALSSVAYSNELDPCAEKAAREYPDSCAVLREHNWRIRKNYRPDAPETAPGLALQLWEKDSGADNAREVVVVVRGTDGLDDLAADTRPFSRFLGGPDDDQYRSAAKLANELISQYTSSHSNVPTPRAYLSGHSLGGGIAQFIFYSHPSRFEQVVTFNPSPVTGYFDFIGRRGASCACNEDLFPEASIYRIFERGEFLNYARGSIPLTRNTHHLSFNLLSGGPFSQHGIESMVRHMRDLISAKGLSWPVSEEKMSWMPTACMEAILQYGRESCGRFGGLGLYCPR